MEHPHQTIKINIELPVSFVQNWLRAIALITLTLVIGSNSPRLMDSVMNEPPTPTQIMQ